jgi:AcrR family transcriptional regulator
VATHGGGDAGLSRAPTAEAPGAASGGRSAGRKQQRGEQTRLKIKQTLIELLNDHDFFELTIADICQAAHVATGGFYFHYPKKADLIFEVIQEHSAEFWAMLDAALHYQDPYSALFHATTALARAYRDSPGLVRCFNQLAMTDRVFVEIWESAAALWVARLVEKLKLSEAADARLLNEVNAYGLLSFVDQLLFKIYIERDPLMARAAGGVDEIIESIATLWHRGLVGRSPPAARLTFAVRGRGV